jgi:hypothetical protein
MSKEKGIALSSVPHPVAPWWPSRVAFWFRRRWPSRVALWFRRTRPAEDAFETVELNLGRVSKTGFKINKLPKLARWHKVISATENPEGGWLIQTPDVKAACWEDEVLPKNPLFAYIKEGGAGQAVKHVVVGFYDAEGFVRTRFLLPHRERMGAP